MKQIVLLSDGTGNSASALFKTNVWRLYQALDLDGATRDAPAQIACYNDGVGTSAFRPLAVLGGVFGWGLKRNVLHLYEFLCRNYEPGDRIHAFGFSRGAFTIRILVALIVSQGIVKCGSNAELRLAARDAYRTYRETKVTNWTRSPLVPILRRARDWTIALKRRIGHQPFRQYARHTDPDTTRIAFLGVWDTVDAYGLPVAELTRGFDLVVWPLSMPDRILSENVDRARHALALDDERDTFHPVLWDEVAEAAAIAAGRVASDRLTQVWFPGMHADVGGGYPDDAMAMIPLV